jgi:hypothetical protein
MTVRRLIIGGLLALAMLSVLLQTVIDHSIENIASACLVLASSMSILMYIGWTRALALQPLSTFAIFGFCATTQLGALLAQTAAWTALRSSLYDPLYTFGTLAFFQLIATVVHATYTFLLKSKHPRIAPVRWLLNWAGLYRRPSPGVLWIMGALGILGIPLSGGTGGLSKFVAAFQFLTWAPFLIPLYLREAGPSYCNATRAIPMVILYALMVGLVGVAVNARGIMFIGLVTICLSYLFFGFRSTAPARINRVTLVRVGALVAVALALARPLADLATAMAIARAHRGKVPAIEMIENTFDAWRKPYLISQYRANDKSAITSAYDENYIANPMIARFVETKFHDNSLYFAGLLSAEDSQVRLRKVTIDALWAILPTPILKLLHISIDKADLNFSIGDYLVYLSRGLPLGGRKTGSVFAEGIALLGPLFPICYAAVCLVTFKLMDLLTVRPVSGPATMSALAKMQAWPLFIYGVTGESINAMMIFIIREPWQSMLIYTLVFSLASLVIRTPAVSPDDSGVPDQMNVR